MDTTTFVVCSTLILGGISLFLILDTIRLHRIRWARRNANLLGN